MRAHHLKQTTTVNSLWIQQHLHKSHIVGTSALWFSLFNTRRRAGLINLMHCFFKMSASKIQRRSGLKSRDTENMIKAIKAVCNKEIGYLADAKNITCPVLHYTITFAQIGTLFMPPSQNLGVSQLFLQLLKRSLLTLCYWVEIFRIHSRRC